MESFTQCANHSVGPANQLFGLLLQTLVQAQCSISPPDMWPKDYGPTAIEKGNYYEMQIRDCTLGSIAKYANTFFLSVISAQFFSPVIDKHCVTIFVANICTYINEKEHVIIGRHLLSYLF